MYTGESEVQQRRRGWIGRVFTSSIVALAVVAMTGPRGAGADTGVPDITVHAVRYDFEPAEIMLKKGQTVRLTFVADDVPHGISIDGLGIGADLPKRKPQTFTVTPSAVGDFDGECSRYCGVGHRDMTFLVHVVP